LTVCAPSGTQIEASNQVASDRLAIEIRGNILRFMTERLSTLD
jgi:hypothetical protein